MSAEHSPLPWCVVGIKQPHSIDGGTISIDSDKPFERYAIQMVYYDEHGRRCTRFIADVLPTYGYENELEGNANLIVTAVNLHAELLAAAKAAVDCDQEGYRRRSLQFDALRIAIAKAEESAP